MSYIGENLITGENIIYKTKLHKIIFAGPAIWLVVALILFGSEDAKSVGLAFVVFGIIHGAVAFASYSTSEFGLTNKRVLMKTGFIRSNSIELLLQKVEGNQVKQGILWRVFGYGLVVITGSGGAKNPFKKISNPFEFRKKVQEKLSEVHETK